MVNIFALCSSSKRSKGTKKAWIIPLRIWLVVVLTQSAHIPLVVCHMVLPICMETWPPCHVPCWKLEYLLQWKQPWESRYWGTTSSFCLRYQPSYFIDLWTLANRGKLYSRFIALSWWNKAQSPDHCRIGHGFAVRQTWVKNCFARGFGNFTNFLKL
jgi:hypothetical protein